MPTRGGRGETQEKKRKFIMLIDPRDRRHDTRSRLHGNGQEAEVRSKGKVLAIAFIEVSTGKARQDKVNSLELTRLNNFFEF